MRKVLFLIAILLLFCAGALTILSIRFEHGESFPVLSTHRSDPMGMKVFYEGLQKTDGLIVQRNYKDLKSLDLDSSTVIFAGVEVSQMSNGTEFVTIIDSLLSKGNRVVIALDEFYVFGNTLKINDPLNKNNDSPFFKRGLTSIKDSVNDTNSVITENKDYYEMTWPGAAIAIDDTSWRSLVSRNDGMLLGDKQILNGTLVLLNNSFNISNQGLRYNLFKKGTNALIPYLVGSNKKIIFDEWHIGVKHKTGIASLIGRFGFAPVIVFGVLWFLLFAWYRYGQITPGDKSGNRSQGQYVEIDTIKLMLLSYIPEEKIINSCICEWKKSFPDRQLPEDSGKTVVEKYNSIYKQVAMRPKL